MPAPQEWIRGRVRLARGRCPSCASDAPEGCGVCLGYRGPFPAEDRTRSRWRFRFGHAHRERAFPGPVESLRRLARLATIRH
jgi:hypothetical protein